ncbi:MAG: methionine synthase, partial [Actinomycetota bacterium]|nr:methionine synthase [Actinomycetota bacterium]
HHFGRPDLKETVRGIRKISESKLIDIISLGPDQNTQEFFFHPEKMDEKQNGAGGVPIRSEKDLGELYKASKTGNYPLMRCYSGTNDIVEFAKILKEKINNAWCAVPLCWYNEIDNRSKRSLVDSIAENQAVMKWHAQQNIPVEVNESHHWSLRYAPDSIAVAAAYIAAYNAKKMGVRTYVSQYMFNTPPETSFKMDLAKMLAKIQLIESLHDETFTTLRQSRTGLFSMSGNFYANKGQLASSTMLQMQINPHIVHVVAYCESEHAAKPADIIESSEIVVRVINNYLNGCPDMKNDSEVIVRKKQLIKDAGLVIEKIKDLNREGRFADPLIEPEIISRSIKIGILDAPHLKDFEAACGKIKTGFFNGANLTVGKDGKPIDELERLNDIV